MKVISKIDKIYWVPLNCGGSSGSCGWKELPQVDCDSNKCRGRISLSNAITEGYTGACYFQKENDNQYGAGALMTPSTGKTTDMSTSVLECTRPNDINTGDRVLDATHKAYYRYCF